MIKKDVLETDFIDRLFDKAKKYFRPIYSIIIIYSRNIANEVEVDPIGRHLE
ncbi:MAG: hypothetical protein U9Q80_10505 [Bacillota bacterium]|nr:hypothetical protein [Bacillota bacterium]